MFSALLERASQYPALRRPITVLWRKAWRLRRATFAKAVLIVQDQRGHVLAIRTPGCLQLPSVDLHGSTPVTTQVEEYLQGLSEACTTSLVAVDGRPGPDGVTFLYGATYEGDALREGHLLLNPNVAASCLNEAENQLLRLCIAHQNNLLFSA